MASPWFKMGNNLINPDIIQQGLNSVGNSDSAGVIGQVLSSVENIGSLVSASINAQNRDWVSSALDSSGQMLNQKEFARQKQQDNQIASSTISTVISVIGTILMCVL